MEDRFKKRKTGGKFCLEDFFWSNENSKKLEVKNLRDKENKSVTPVRDAKRRQLGHYLQNPQY